MVRWRRVVGALAQAGLFSLPTAPPTPSTLDLPATDPGFVLELTPPDFSRLPRQGGLSDCWIMGPMLAIHCTCPEFFAQAVRRETLHARRDAHVAWVRLYTRGRPVWRRIECSFPVREAPPGGRCGTGVSCGSCHSATAAPAAVAPAADLGPVRWAYAIEDALAVPGWPGLVEKAAVMEVAGSYRWAAFGLASSGFPLLCGIRTRTFFFLPAVEELSRWLAEGRAATASTHPLSPMLSRGLHDPDTGAMLPKFPLNHVFAVVGADPARGWIRVRNPVQPAYVYTLTAAQAGRVFVSLDVTRAAIPASKDRGAHPSGF